MDANKTPSFEKQKKGNLYVYKFSPISVPRGRTDEHHPPMTKKIISMSLWGLRKSTKSKLKSKSNPESVQIKGLHEGKKEDKKSILMSLTNAGESISGLEEEVKRRGFSLIATQEEGVRKSVSHVENMAYKGKIVEERRRSTGAKLENTSNNKNVESSMELLQVKVLMTDMPGFMQLHASQCARKTYDSLEKFSAKHMAFNLKKEFDKVYGPAWHCIVGSSFGSFVTHSTGCFLYLSMEKLCILLFRTKVMRAF